MRISRRKLLQWRADRSRLPALTRIASAQTYPARPVRLVVGFAAGGPNDITARIIAQWLSERLGQQFIVENRPGAGSNIATEFVVRAPADGYTLLLVPPPAAINTTLYDNLSFNFLRDIAPGRRHRARPRGHGRQSIAAGRRRARVHRLRQGASRQDQHGRRPATGPCRTSPASCSSS